MDIVNLIASYGPWAWVVAGAIFLALELVVPGGIMLWLGVAGIITGLAALFQPLSWPLQFLLFGGLSLVLIVGWLRYSKGREAPNDSPFLNRRAERFVGQEVVLDEPIRDGFGRVNLGDSTWRIAGPDLPAGQRIRITGADGAVLRVEAV
jgi:membrane protein implicated in regulation of membrane protease activity